MKRSGNIAGRVIATILLFVFSVTVTPLDFLHRHSPEPVCSVSPDGSTCSHKQHLSKKSSFCMLCAVHHDQLIAPVTPGNAVFLPVVNVIFPDPEPGSVVLASPRSCLRGPPESQVTPV